MAIESSHHHLQNQRREIRSGLTVLELLVALSAIGIIMSLLLSALVHARESSRSVACKNHLRQMGLALHSHHDRFRKLPSAWCVANDDSEFAYGWVSELLAELEQNSVGQSFSDDRRPSELVSRQLASELTLPVMLCPSDIATPVFQLLSAVDDHDDLETSSSRSSQAVAQVPQELGYLPTSNYVGVYGTVEPDDFDEFVGSERMIYGDGSLIDEKRVTFADLTRGLSNTMLVGERTMARFPSSWLGFDMRGEDQSCHVAGSAITHPNCDQCDECEFDSRHVGGSHFLWADGRVTLVSQNVDQQIYQRSAQRNR